jgi:hypothetical protein
MFGITIHPFAKIVLGIAIFMYPLGVNDLGHMID